MSEERVSVLLVAGDAALRHAIRTALRATEFAFEEVGIGLEATQRVLRGSHDLALISLGENQFSAFETCRNLRAASPRLGIVLIRSAGTQEDDIRAIQAGADDCVAFPFRFRAVMGRIQAVLRRGPVRAADRSILRAGNVKLDVGRRIFWRAHDSIHLSPREFDLLAVLMKHEGNTLTHLKLLVAVWGPTVKHEARYLRSYIKSLRKKIETHPTNPQYILTVAWVGYVFRDPNPGVRQKRPSML